MESNDKIIRANNTKNRATKRSPGVILTLYWAELPHGNKYTDHYSMDCNSKTIVIQDFYPGSLRPKGKNYEKEECIFMQLNSNSRPVRAN